MAAEFLADWTNTTDAAIHWGCTRRNARFKLEAMRRAGAVERRDCWKRFKGGDSPQVLYYEYKRKARKRRKLTE